MPLRLSVVDQSPVSAGSTAADALHNTIDLARLTERLGYTRYWIAEHHAHDCSRDDDADGEDDGVLVARPQRELGLGELREGSVGQWARGEAEGRCEVAAAGQQRDARGNEHRADEAPGRHALPQEDGGEYRRDHDARLAHGRDRRRGRTAQREQD